LRTGFSGEYLEPKEMKCQGNGENYVGKEFHNLYSSDVIRVTESSRMRWAGHIARIGEMKIAFRIGLRPSRSLKNIKMDLK
jgi:hypothetical protein